MYFFFYFFFFFFFFNDTAPTEIYTTRHTLSLHDALPIFIVFLFHVRSALIPILALPVAVLASFIPMYYLDVSSNIMSLGGLALAIGVLVDASIVMVENAHRHLAAVDSVEGSAGRESAILTASQQVGRAIFFSLVIIVISFLPVFLLTGEEGRLFHPLAFTK